MSMRDKIAGVLVAPTPMPPHGGVHMSGRQARIAADAIIAALPDMIPDLVWENDWLSKTGLYQIHSDNGGSGAPDDPYERFCNFRVFEPLFHCSIGPVGDGSDQFETLEEAKAAANAHHKAAIMAAFGVTV